MATTYMEEEARRLREYPPEVGTYFRGQIRRAAWSAIFAAAFIAAGIEFTLTALGITLGVPIITAASPANPLGAVGAGAAFWLGITTIISLFIGGYAAGRLSGSLRPAMGLWHGLAMWGLVSVFSFLSVNYAFSAFFGGAAGMLGRGLAAPAGGGVVLSTEAISTASRVALGIFLALLFSGGAAALGGWLGVSKKPEFTEFPQVPRG